MTADRSMPWELRSPSIASMLNPALIAHLIAAASSGYSRTAGKGMPYELAFLVPPLVLHRPTRGVIPRNTNSYLAKWTVENSRPLVGFASRAKDISRYTREGLRFGLRGRLLQVDESGLLVCDTRRMGRLSAGSELDELVRKSALIGRWFGKEESITTTFAVLGVAP